MSVIANLAIFPLDKGEELSDSVAIAVKIIRESGLPYVLGPMATSIEGDYDAVMDVVRQCFMALQAQSNRVYMTIGVDYRGTEGARMPQKVSAVTTIIGPANTAI